MEEKLLRAKELMNQIDKLVDEAFGEMNEMRDTNDISGILDELDNAAAHMMLIFKCSSHARGNFSYAIDKLKKN